MKFRLNGASLVHEFAKSFMKLEEIDIDGHSTTFSSKANTLHWNSLCLDLKSLSS